MNVGQIHRLNFSPLSGLSGNAAKSVTLSLPWRSVWRSKGVDEEPLEPARHMEVYMKVLKYFQQLDMNCKTAVESYPVGDLILKKLTDDDDYLDICIENVNRRYHQFNFNTAHSSKTAHATVIGKTFQLIENATGRVIKEIALTRNTIKLRLN
jgi:hypothetical protein